MQQNIIVGKLMNAIVLLLSSIAFKIVAVFFAVLLSCSYSAYSQYNIIDSLQGILQYQNEDTGKVNVLHKLSKSYLMSGQYDRSVFYIKQALTLSEKIGFKKGIGYSYIYMGRYYNSQFKYNESAVNLNTGLKIMIDLGFQEGIADAHFYIARLYVRWLKAPQALASCYEALKFYEKLKNKTAAAEVFQILCDINKGVRDYSKALEYQLAVLNILKEIGPEIKTAAGYMYIGEIHDHLHNESAAIESYQKSMGLLEKLKDSNANGSEKLETYYYLGSISNRLNRPIDAIKNYNEALIHAQKQNAMFYTAEIYGLIGRSYLNLSKKRDEHNERSSGEFLKNAILNLEMAENLYRQLGFKVNILGIYLEMAKAKIELGDFLTAEKLISKSVSLSKSINFKIGFVSAYELLSSLDSTRGNWKSAFEHYKTSVLFRDSVNNEEVAKKSLQVTMQYDFDKKEDSLKQQQVITETRLALQKKQRYLYLGGLIMLSALSFFVFLNFRNQKKINRLAAEVHERQRADMELNHQSTVMNERLRISRELHDEVGATLSGIAMYSHLAKEQIKNNKATEVEKSLNVMQQSSGEMVNKLNDIVWLVNPEQDSLQKLIERLEEYARNMASIKNMQVKINVPEKISQIDLPVESRRNIYLFCKEAINNAVKYSGGNLLELNIKEADGKLEFSVSDNGKGFDVVMVRRGNGLENMQKRADEVGAKLVLTSKENEGTSLSLVCNIT